MTVDRYISRRTFLTGTLGGMALAACASKKQDVLSPPAPSSDPGGATGQPTKQSILILGGTGFLGPHVVDAAVARGHTITLFNRGKTKPQLFPGIEKLHGDRDGDLKSLEGRSWDAVVDTSGYVPRVVRASAELLAPRIKQYVFLSSISAYAGFEVVHADETAALALLSDPKSEDVQKDYGALKAACEAAAEAAMPGKVTNLRPGLIVGPLDPTGRFTHWVSRMADGGEVLAPGDGKTLIQWIDGRDLAAFIVRSIEDRKVGVYNAVGPAQAPTMREVLETCNTVAGGKARLTWVDAAFLEAQKVTPWGDLPMWIPPEGDYAGFGTTSNARAVAAGLTFRPLATTAADTLAWVRDLPPDAPPRARSSGLSRDREAAVLAAFHAR